MTIDRELVSSTDDSLTEMTRFKVDLTIDVVSKEVESIGYPDTWNWDRIVERGIGDDAQPSVKVNAVVLESKFLVSDDGDEAQETTYTPIYISPSSIEKSFDKILGYAQDYIADNRYKYDGLEEEQRADLKSLTEVRDFARHHFCNPEIGDSHIDNFIQGFHEKPTVQVISLETGEDITSSCNLS